MKHLITILLVLFGLPLVVKAQSLIIQENETGFCSIDGILDTGVGGYTGDGYLNGDSGEGTSALWSFEVPADGEYSFRWRFANGGGAGDLLSELWVNEVYDGVDVNCFHTGSWTNWMETNTITLPLNEGVNKVRLVSISPNGLANIDYFEVLDDNAMAVSCLPTYSIHVIANDPDAGTVSYEPVKPFYEEGEMISLSAEANSGYYFQSWSGAETSVDADHSFVVKAGGDVTALFYPDGTEAEDGAMGYATVQDDAGTPYLMTGGLYGDTVLATNFAELKTYLEDTNPYVVTVDQYIMSTGQINIASNKTFLGLHEEAHLEGIRFKINGSENVIIRDLTFSKVVTFDAIEINGGSEHIWIDNCEFFTDLDHDSDYYDGLMDIKNESRFITISNSHFHDHFKAVLISSGDDSFQDTSIRITFYHNYFEHLGSRTPLIRFGKAHIFNNYYESCSNGINPRMGACVRIENNFFFQVSNAVRVDMSDEVGFMQLIDNVFMQSSYVSEPTCELEVPYEYLSFMTEAEQVPYDLTGGSPLSASEQGAYDMQLGLFPNPTFDELNLSLQLPEATPLRIEILDLTGKRMLVQEEEMTMAGRQSFMLSLNGLSKGSYLCRIKTDSATAVQTFVKL
ncbi:MAG: T9SS type A sorting domain-containing protein [Bacteroidetes bacterium]|nr:T9SS type A sorting domain-containing protein [Bacteroidota bacterium]